MGNKPLISIIIPLYNSASYLHHCLQSIMQQTYQYFEVIMVDDASQDDTVKQAQKWVHSDPRFYLYQQHVNHGVSTNRNIGLSHARGTYVSFVDPDDWCAPDFLQTFINHSSGNDLVITGFYCNEHVASSIWPLQQHYYSPGQMLPFIMANFGNIRGYVWNKCYRRQLIAKYHLRFDTDLTIMEDMLFNVKYLMHAQRCYYTSQPHYHYVKRHNSTVHTVNKRMLQDIFKAIWRSSKVVLLHK
ncbi:MAG: glycosyltransferase [Candidatus Paralactobacillus gallistercoris]|uniref:Glycosyltransferase n=1 Tax=Candidatus Paralactobacillus gallistercoris TaxID=2838724 RepID=A0A948X0H6_9LACO|nr:glycosyltransferase [Candidatus Paralactobacillus gallistercoris]